MTARRAVGRCAVEALPGFTPIEGNLVVWSAGLAAVRDELAADPAALGTRVVRRGVDALALEVTPADVPTPPWTAAVARFVDELQLRGTSVGLWGTLPAFLTAARMDDLHARFATFDDLASCVRTLRDHEALRRRCVSRPGAGVHRLRLSARAVSLAPLCLFVRDRLERAGVAPSTVLAMLREAYGAMVDALAESWESDDADLSASVTVHEGTASVTILDMGHPRTSEVLRPGDGAPFDRIHRFRIPERHNALVLEKHLGPEGQSR